MKAFIESVKGSNTRSRYDELSFKVRESFALPCPYPYDYGFIPGTAMEDGDCLDCFVVSSHTQAQASLVECEAWGMVEMIEDGEVDHKVILCPVGEEPGDIPGIHAIIGSFLEAVFTLFPEARMAIGPLVPRDETRAFVESRLHNQESP